MTIDLTPFCGKGDVRTYLNAPFAIAGGTGASNGLILVWLAEEICGTLIGPKEAEFLGRLEQLIVRAKSDWNDADSQWVSVETIYTVTHKCPHCDGTRLVSIAHCDDCDGEGSFWHGNHEYDCKNCEGAGEAKETGFGEPCDECEGTGKSGLREPCSFGFAGQFDHDSWTVESALVSRLRKLPGCRIKRYDSRPSEGLTFVFDGGVGIVMPLWKRPRP